MSFCIFLLTDALISDEVVATISALVCTKASLWTEEYRGTIVHMTIQLLGEICSPFLGALWGHTGTELCVPSFLILPPVPGIPPS